MMQFILNRKSGQPLTLLCLGAHSDDIEIGCGGTILRLATEHPGSVFHWVVFSATGAREPEARRGSELFTAGGRVESLRLGSFRDGFMPFEGAAVKDFFEELKGKVNPDIVFTHNRNDAHQDHRLLSELTWNTFRNHLILEYEIPKYDGDMGRPNVFVPLSAEQCQQKVHHVMETFASQRSKPWFDEQTFLGLMRLRGMECNAPSGYAEAYYGHKVIL